MKNESIIFSFENYLRNRSLNFTSLIIPFLILLAIISLLPIRPTLLTLCPLYIVAILLIIYKPEIVIILVVIFTSTIFTLDAFPQPVSLGEIGFYLPEILIVLLLVRTIIVALIKKDFRKMSSPLTIPVVLLFLWILFSVVNALLSMRTSLLEAVLISRSYIYYANFFLILYYLHTREKIDLLLKSLIIIAGICAIFSFIQYLIGPDKIIFPWNAWTVAKIDYNLNEPTLARVMPTSISLIYISFFPVLIGVINGGLNKNWWYKIFIIIAILSLFLSFTRNVYYSVIIGFFLIWMNFKGRIRRNMTRNIITIFSMVILIAYLPVFLGLIKVTNWWQQVFSRQAEFFIAGTQTETLIWRVIETRAIIEGIANSPVLGNGIGATYYHPLYGVNVAIAHNGYLSIIFQMGLVGLIIFLFIFYKYLFSSIKIYRKMKNGYDKSLILGFLVAFIALLPAVWVKPIFVQEHHWISLIGLIWAFPEVILRINNNK